MKKREMKPIPAVKANRWKVKHRQGDTTALALICGVTPATICTIFKTRRARPEYIAKIDAYYGKPVNNEEGD